MNAEDLKKIRQGRREAILLLCVLAFATFAIVKMRESKDYRKAIYETEATTGAFSASNKAVERLIGKPNINYSKSAIKPKYPHFWDGYEAGE